MPLCASKRVCAQAKIVRNNRVFAAIIFLLQQAAATRNSARAYCRRPRRPRLGRSRCQTFVRALRNVAAAL